jgi:hypothetical protein
MKEYIKDYLNRIVIKALIDGEEYINVVYVDDFDQYMMNDEVRKQYNDFLTLALYINIDKSSEHPSPTTLKEDLDNE